MIHCLKNNRLIGAADRPFAFDIFYDQTVHSTMPVIIFSHGFKGFKDWGHWAAMAHFMAAQGCVVINMNFSHNGVTIDQPLDFADLEAFGQNRYSYEAVDIQRLLDWLHSDSCTITKIIDLDSITLVGHSRAGATTLLVAAEDERISKLVSWASVSRFDYSDLWLDEALCRDWLKEGVTYILNGRTQQMMPLYRSLYDDWARHTDQFNSLRLALQLQKPWLIIHGSDDPAVPVEAAHALFGYANQELTSLFILETDHVFHGRHPHQGELHPVASQVALATAAHAHSTGA